MSFEPSKPMPVSVPRTWLDPDDAFVVELLTRLDIRHTYSNSRRERELIQQISVLVRDLELREPLRVREALLGQGQRWEEDE